MFTVHCPCHGSDVLLTERRIEEIVDLPDRHAVRYRCWCGRVGSTEIPRSRAARAAMAGRHRPAV